MKNIFLQALQLCLVISAFAQESIKKYASTKIDQELITIDGLINDKAWEAVEWGGDFVQREPTYGVAPSQKTVFKILYDDKNLYVAIRAFDTEPDKIARRMSRRDGFEGDFVEINIDSYNDKRTAFSFTASVSGVKGDEYISNNGDNWDDTWDPIWYLGTSIDNEGWVAEFRIPLSQLRFADVPVHQWGLQFTRRIFRLEERSVWQPIPQDAPGWVHLFGSLEGIVGIKPQKQLEIQPYVVAKTDRYPQEEGNPFATGKDNDLDYGIDAKIGLTSDITLDLSINPDFGQVEADPSQVNLTAFRLFFQERRPFFLEGNNVLNFPIVGFMENNLFYSRQIGGSPSYYPNADYVNMPNHTRILGAAKITGKNSKGFSWGVLESVTNDEKAETITNGVKSKETVEPLTNYVVARFQQDIKEGETVVGAMFTATNRFITDSTLDFLHKSAYSGGVDLLHNFKERKYVVTLRSLFSNVNGSTQSIYNTQLASERFFQRPDNNYSRLDSSRQSLTGSAATLSLAKQSGKWLWDIGGTYSSPQLELNDAGFLVQSDNMMQWLWTQYRILQPKGIFRSQRFTGVQWSAYDFDGVNLETGYETGYNAQLNNLWRVNLGTVVNGETVSNADLRGGPSIRYPGSKNVFFNLSTNDQKKFTVSYNQNFRFGNEDYMQSANSSLFMIYRPFNAVSLSINPSYFRNRNDLQYVTDLDVSDGSHRYILGRVNQYIYRLTLRSTLNVTPNLTFELWAQPFIATGEYSQFKKTIDPSTNKFSERFQQYQDIQVGFESGTYTITENSSIAGFAFSDPDFNIREFRSNLVMRWEYIPGSTLFLVWSSNGSAFDNENNNNLRSQTNGLLNLESRNTFLIKFTYRFIL